MSDGDIIDFAHTFLSAQCDELKTPSGRLGRSCTVPHMLKVAHCTYLEFAVFELQVCSELQFLTHSRRHPA